MPAYPQRRRITAQLAQHIGIVHQPQKIIGASFRNDLHQCKGFLGLVQHLPGSGHHIDKNALALLTARELTDFGTKQSGVLGVDQQPKIGDTRGPIGALQ